MKKTAAPSQADPSPEDVNRLSRIFIFVSAVWIAVFLMIGALIGRGQWNEAQIRNHGRTVPAQILRVQGLRVQDELGGDGSATVEYAFTLPSGQRIVDTVNAPRTKVEEALGVVRQGFPPATVQYMPDDPSRHRLLGFQSSAGSPFGPYVILGLFVFSGGSLLRRGLRMRREALAAAPGGSGGRLD